MANNKKSIKEHYDKVNNVMQDTISPISILITSIVVITLGILLLFNPESLENIITTLIPILIIGIGVLSIISYIFSRNKKEANLLIKGILYILLGLFVKYKVEFIESSIVFIIGAYAFINFIAQLISTLILYKNKTKEWRYSFVSTITSFVFGFILVTNPVGLRGVVSKLAGIYLIFFGLTIFGDFIREVFGTKGRNTKLKRKIRIRLPVIYTAFVPQKILEKINESLETNNVPVFVESKNNQKGELEIFVHLAKNVAHGFGHVDICYKDVMYTYGTYDSSSNRFFDLVSDGVLIEVDRKKYIEFNIKRRHLISFVLTLTPNQCKAIEKRIEGIKNTAYRWHCEAETNKDKEYKDFSNSLYLQTNAKFYKFKSGYFKTYFVLITNCVKLADTIVGAAGIDALVVNGIITPGIYFNYLNNLFLMKNSIVIRRNVFNMRK